MRRDPDLIRAVMLTLEPASAPVTGQTPIEEWSKDEVSYHLAQVIDAKLAVRTVHYRSDGSDPTIPGFVKADRLTPAGHDFIDAIREQTIWNAVKGKLVAVGGSVPIAIMVQLAVAEGKKRLGLS